MDNESSMDIVAANSPEQMVNKSDPEETSSGFSIKRKPYNKTYYTLYGNDENTPELINLDETLNFLINLGYGDNSLKQARDKQKLSDKVNSAILSDEKVKHRCDFCGRVLDGVEFDELKDGRERCVNCTRSVLTKRSQYERLYDETVNRMEFFYGVKTKSHIKVEVFNTKILEKKAKTAFTLGPSVDKRFVGLACKEKSGKIVLYLENGSPRLATILTLVHLLTNVWQSENWNKPEICKNYGTAQYNQIVEGMAVWVKIQYLFLIGEVASGKQEELLMLSREDDSGKGFAKYCKAYPLTYTPVLDNGTPFDNVHKPI